MILIRFLCDFLGGGRGRFQSSLDHPPPIPHQYVQTAKTGADDDGRRLTRIHEYYEFKKQETNVCLSVTKILNDFRSKRMFK